MGSVPDLITEILPFARIITAIDELVPNLFGSISGSLGVDIPEVESPE